MHVLRTHTLTHTKKVCNSIPLWRTGSVGQNRFPDATSSCSVALPQFSAVFLLGENVPLTPLHLFLVTGCIDLLLSPYLTHARPSLEP